MSVGRKEGNSLVEKAGKAIVDLALSLSSRNAISNAACSEGMRLRNVTYYNGKLYQLNLDGTRGDEIKMGDGVYLLTNTQQEGFYFDTAQSGSIRKVQFPEFKLTASSGFGSDYQLYNMYYSSTANNSENASPKGYWLSYSGQTTAYLIYDFYSPKYVAHVDCVHEYAAQHGSCDIQLQYSDDGNSWTNCSDTVTMPHENLTSVSVTCKEKNPHRYWRLYMTNRVGDYYGLRTALFFGKDAGDV